MNKEDFVSAIKMVVHDSTIEGIKRQLARPAGRNPRKKLKELSAWFNGLAENEKTQVAELIRQTVHASIFGILCVLDGVRAIESTSDKGEIRLVFLKDGRTTHLNAPEGEMLHDIYQLQVQGEVFGKE